MNRDIERIILNKEQIAEKVAQAAKWLDGKFTGLQPLALCTLKGGVMFFCDLVRAMNTPVQIDFITASSYGSQTKSSGKVELKDFSVSVADRDVILVEDIVDSGNTLLFMRNLILRNGAKSFTAVALFDKPCRRTAEISADYSCFEVGDDFIVGYGLDYDQNYRNLPYVGILRKEIYKKSS